MSGTLRVGVIQLRSGIEPAANRAAALPLLRQAASAGARLLVTPENTHRLDRDRPRLRAGLATEDQAAELRAWGLIARELSVWLLLGSMPVPSGPEPDGKVFNRSVLFDPDGRVVVSYDKINLFDVTLGGGETYRESEAVAPGSRAVVADGPQGVKLGLSICYDLRFAELYGALARAGAQVITVPSAFTRPTGEAHWQTLLRARAIETGAFILAPAQGGVHEDGRATYGHSLVVGPWGEVLGHLDHDEPAALVCDLDLTAVATARGKIPAWQGGRGFEGP